MQAGTTILPALWVDPTSLALYGGIAHLKSHATEDRSLRPPRPVFRFACRRCPCWTQSFPGKDLGTKLLCLSGSRGMKASQEGHIHKRVLPQEKRRTGTYGEEPG